MGASERNTARRRAVSFGADQRTAASCHFCGYRPRRKDPPLTLDHVIARSRGGPNSAWNRILACAQCNWDKRSKTYEEFTGLDELPVQCRPFFRTTAAFEEAQLAAIARVEELRKSPQPRILP